MDKNQLLALAEAKKHLPEGYVITVGADLQQVINERQTLVELFTMIAPILAALQGKGISGNSGMMEIMMEAGPMITALMENPDFKNIGAKVALMFQQSQAPDNAN